MKNIVLQTGCRNVKRSIIGRQYSDSQAGFNVRRCKDTKKNRYTPHFPTKKIFNCFINIFLTTIYTCKYIYNQLFI